MYLNKNRFLRNENLVLYLTAAIIAAVSFFRLQNYSDPSGGDGYFYLKQAEVLANSLRFYHADYSFIFIPLALLTKLTGSSLLSYQIIECLSFFTTLSCVGLFISRGLCRFEKCRPYILVALLTAFSFQTPLLRLNFEFIKNGFAIALVLLATNLFYERCLKSALIIAIIAALSHKTVALIIIFSLAIFVLTSPKMNKKLITLVALITGAVVAFNPRFSSHIQYFIKQIRIEPLHSIVNLNSHLTGPHILLIIFWLTFFFTQIRHFYSEPKQNKVIIFNLVFFSLASLLPLFAGDNYEIKWRLMIFSFCFSFILFNLALAKLKNKKTLIAVIFVSLIFMSYEVKHQSGFPWIISYSNQVPQLISVNQFVRPDDQLITHHGMQFYIDYKTPIRAKSLINLSDLPKYQVAYLPEFFMQNDTINDALQQLMLTRLGKSYGLFYYEDFQDLQKQYPYLEHWKNSYKVRPNFVQNYEK